MAGTQEIYRPSDPVLMLFVTLLFISGCRAGPPREDTLVQRGNDLLGGGQELMVRDSVTGDVIVAGGNIRFSGFAAGDYLGAGGRQEIEGTAEGSVRAAGGDIRLRGPVGRNVTLAGGRVELEPGAVVEGNAYLAGGEIRMRGTVNGFVRAMGGNVVINGGIGNDASVQAEQLHVGPDARITGDLRYRVSPNRVTIDPAAQITGEAIALPPARFRLLALLRIAWHVGFLLAGAVAVALLPGVAATASAAVRQRPLLSAAFGLLWIVAVPIVVVLLGMTVVGLPLALIIGALYLISLYLGRAVLAVWLGSTLLGTRTRAGRGGLALSFVIGGLILIAINLLPFLGSLVMLLATLLGTGAAILVLGRRERAAE